MASDLIFLTNPTAATITVDAQSVASGATVSLTLCDATTDLYAFVCKGCIAESLS